MVNRAAYKGEKRQKELARLKKQEEKRLRRLARRTGAQKDGEEIVEGDAEQDGAEPDEPAEEPTETT